MFIFSFISRRNSLLLFVLLATSLIGVNAQKTFAVNQLSVVATEPDPVESRSVDVNITGVDDPADGIDLKLSATSRPAGEPCGPSYKSEIDKGAQSETLEFYADGTFSHVDSISARNTNGTYVFCAYLQQNIFDHTAAVVASTTVTTRRQKASLQIVTSTAVLKGSDGKYTGAVRLTATGLLELESRRLYVKVKREGEPGCGSYLADDQLGFNLGDTYLSQGAFTDQVVAGSGATPGKTYKLCVWIQNGVTDTDPDATASADVTIPSAPAGPDSKACTDARAVLSAKQKALTAAKKKLTQLRKKAKKARGKKAKKKAVKLVRSQQKRVKAAQAAVLKAQTAVNTSCK